MKNPRPPHPAFVVPFVSLALLLAFCGCAPKVYFDGVALVRTNGDVVVVQQTDSIAALRNSSLKLSEIEVQLLTTLSTHRDQAHAAARTSSASDAQAGRCLSSIGSPYCYPVWPCVDCKLITVGINSQGSVGTVVEASSETAISAPLPLAYYCECTASKDDGSSAQ